MRNLFTIKEIEISYNSNTIKADRTRITNSIDTFEVSKEVFKNSIEYKESFFLMILNNANEILGIKKISEGGLAGTVVDVRLIFQTILKAHGTGFIILHNHPSGNLQPSEADKTITNTIKQGAKVLNLNLLDHLIITKENYFSFADSTIL
ncbi:JAB domain-containing protein [Flavicella sp.]|uniref:JAB domain-containing protein n=1 Tax=Flavicella sp. TaxID=2957742 RepID=UPI00301A9935